MTNEFPEKVIESIKELRSLNDQFDMISYRMGTHGERGLFPQRKSLRAQIVKAEKEFAKRFPDFELVKHNNSYYVRGK